MLNFTIDQIIVVAVLSVWFLFPIGMLISFIKQSNEALNPKVTQKLTANDIAHSPQYTPHTDDDDTEEDEVDEMSNVTSIAAHQSSKSNKKSTDYHPSV